MHFYAIHRDSKAFNKKTLAFSLKAFSFVELQNRRDPQHKEGFSGCVFILRCRLRVRAGSGGAVTGAAASSSMILLLLLSVFPYAPRATDRDPSPRFFVVYFFPRRTSWVMPSRGEWCDTRHPGIYRGITVELLESFLGGRIFFFSLFFLSFFFQSEKKKSDKDDLNRFSPVVN